MVLPGAKAEHSLHNRDAQENREEVFAVPTNNTIWQRSHFSATNQA